MLWENDSWFWKPEHRTDRFYTNGTEFFVGGQPEFLQGLDLVPFWDTRGDRYAGALLFGQQMYTPGDITIAAPQPHDHPWAGYIYGGGVWQRAKGDTLDTLRLEIGSVGPNSLAEETQKWVHRHVGADEPMGWENQIHNEITGQLDYRKKWRFTCGEFHNNFDVIPAAGFNLGSVHRELVGDVTMRLGINLPDDFGPSRIGDLAALTGHARRGFSVYGFARAGGRIVEYNAFLNGNNFQASPGVAIENFVGEVQAGAVMAYTCNAASVELGYSQTLITPEFREQDTNHTFGAWTVSITLLF
jgi:hypothetical protein